MGKTKSKKVGAKVRSWTPVYLKMPNDAYKALLSLEKETGKSRTRIIVDYITEQRQFSPELEDFIDGERSRRGLSSRRTTVEKLISEAVEILKQHQPGKRASSK